MVGIWVASTNPDKHGESTIWCQAQLRRFCAGALAALESAANRPGDVVENRMTAVINLEQALAYYNESALLAGESP